MFILWSWHVFVCQKRQKCWWYHRCSIFAGHIPKNRKAISWQSWWLSQLSHPSKEHEPIGITISRRDKEHSCQPTISSVILCHHTSFFVEHSFLVVNPSSILLVYVVDIEILTFSCYRRYESIWYDHFWSPFCLSVPAVNLGNRLILHPDIAMAPNWDTNSNPSTFNFGYCLKHPSWRPQQSFNPLHLYYIWIFLYHIPGWRALKSPA